jgi:hypothetical protein
MDLMQAMFILVSQSKEETCGRQYLSIQRLRVGVARDVVAELTANESGAVRSQDRICIYLHSRSTVSKKWEIFLKSHSNEMNITRSPKIFSNIVGLQHYASGVLCCTGFLRACHTSYVLGTTSAGSNLWYNKPQWIQFSDFYKLAQFPRASTTRLFYKSYNAPLHNWQYVEEF